MHEQPMYCLEEISEYYTIDHRQFDVEQIVYHLLVFDYQLYSHHLKYVIYQEDDSEVKQIFNRIENQRSHLLACPDNHRWLCVGIMMIELDHHRSMSRNFLGNYQVLVWLEQAHAAHNSPYDKVLLVLERMFPFDYIMY